MSDPQRTPAPQLTDEAWDFIKKQADDISVTQHAIFEGDWGNWNWLFSEIYKRCVDPATFKAREEWERKIHDQQ